MDNQTDSNWIPKRPREYRLFLIWKSLPSNWLQMGVEYMEALGIDDPDILELVGIKYQKDFAAQFDLDVTTLVLWNNKPVPPEYRDIDWRIWARKLTRNVMQALFEGMMTDKDAARAKLWLQATDGTFAEKTEVKTDIGKETLSSVKDIINSLNKKDGPSQNDQ